MAICALALAFVAGVALAAGGQLDTSFSGDGKRTTSFGSGTTDDEGNGVAIQGNGRIVVVGSSGQAGGDFGVIRYRPGGSLDQSFSGNGKRTISFQNGTDFDDANDVAIQPDGKLVVAGTSDQSNQVIDTGNDFALVRLMPDGTLDQTFSGDGKRTTPIGTAEAADEGEGVAVQPNGRIVVVGLTSAADVDFAVARFMPNGSLDQSFSGDGRRTIGFGNPGGTDKPDDVAIQPNGRIVIAGRANKGASGNDFAVARLMPNGSPDQSFSGDGRRTASFGTGDEGSSLAIQPNGRILVAGTTAEDSPGGDFALVRFMPDGSLDQSFSGDGRRTATFGPFFDGAEGVAVQPNGKIVAAGSSDRTGSLDLDFAVARFMPNGSLDLSFSGDGKRMIAFGTGTDEGNALALGTGLGSVGAGIGIGYVVAGFSDQGATTGRDFAVARLLP